MKITILLLIGNLFVSGLATFFMKFGINEVGEAKSRFFRVMSQTVWIVLVLPIIFGVKTAFDFSLRIEILYLAMNGITAGIAFTSYSKALREIDASVGRSILNMNVAITVLLGVLILHEDPTLNKAIGSILALIAIFLLTSEKEYVDHFFD